LSTSAAAAQTPVRRAKISAPLGVINDPRLSPSSRLLYQMLLNAGALESGEVSIPSRDLAARMGVTEDQIGNLTRELRAAGVIETHRRGRKPIRYVLLAIAGAFVIATASVPTQSSATQMPLLDNPSTVGMQFPDTGRPEDPPPKRPAFEPGCR